MQDAGQRHAVAYFAIRDLAPVLALTGRTPALLWCPWALNVVLAWLFAPGVV